MAIDQRALQRTSEGLRRNVVDWSPTLFERLGCRDYARFDDWAVAGGAVKLLEVNSNPGRCRDSKQNLMAEFAGYRYADLLHLILEGSQKRVAHSAGNAMHQRFTNGAVAQGGMIWRA